MADQPQPRLDDRDTLIGVLARQVAQMEAGVHRTIWAVFHVTSPVRVLTHHLVLSAACDALLTLTDSIDDPELRREVQAAAGSAKNAGERGNSLIHATVLPAPFARRVRPDDPRELPALLHWNSIAAFDPTEVRSLIEEATALANQFWFDFPPRLFDEWADREASLWEDALGETRAAAAEARLHGWKWSPQSKRRAAATQYLRLLAGRLRQRHMGSSDS